MDSETFRGIHARLPELGGAVLEATQKLLHNNSAAGPSAQEIVEMFTAPPHPEHTDRECQCIEMAYISVLCEWFFNVMYRQRPQCSRDCGDVHHAATSRAHRAWV
jgi:hypothetical protein